MRRIVFGFLCFINFNLYSQRHNIDWLVPPQGFGIQLMNSLGNSSIINDVSNLGNMNPAAISNFENFSLAFSYQFNSSINESWINNSASTRKNDFIPQSAGGVFKWNDFTLGFGFNQRYNLEVDFNWNTSGVGQADITEFRGRVYTYSSALAYSIKDFIKENSSLTVGVNYSLSNVNFSQKNFSDKIDLSDNAGNFSFGIQYSIKKDSAKGTMIGLSYITNTKFESEYNIQSGFTVIIRNVNKQNSTAADNFITGNIPDRFNLDLSSDFSDKINLLCSFTGIFWEKDYNHITNQFEFSLGGIYKINKMFSPAFSIYYTDKNYKQDYFELSEKFNTLFLIAGLKFNFDIFSADLAIADSHLFSGDYRKQTIGKLAIGVHL
jgi:hypothetical protein